MKKQHTLALEKDANAAYITNVMFYLEGKRGCNIVLAVFPDLQSELKLHYQCYATAGQHSVCSRAYFQKFRKATKEQYKSLEAELISIGYELHILNKH